MKIVRLFLLLSLCLAAGMVYGQNDPLAPVNTLLDSAEQKLNEGDLASAQGFITSATTLISEEMIANCQFLQSAKSLLENAAAAQDIESATNDLTSARTLMGECSPSEPTPTPIPPPLSPTATPTSVDFTKPTEVVNAIGITSAGNETMRPQNIPELRPNESNQFGEWAYHQFPNTYADFVLHASIGWNEPNAACQINFRDKFVTAYDAYQISITSDGRIVFQQSTGDNWVTKNTSQSSNILQTANHVVLVASGNTFMLYINDLTNPVAVYTDSTFADGGLKLVAFRPASNTPPSSNPAPCSFSEVWLWEPSSSLSLPQPAPVSNVLSTLGKSGGQMTLLVDEVPPIALSSTDGVWKWGTYELMGDHTDFVFHANITSDGESGVCQVDFRSQGGNFYKLSVDSSNGNISLSMRLNEIWTTLGNVVTQVNTSNELVVDVVGNTFTVYLNGQQIPGAPFTDNSLTTGKIYLVATTQNLTQLTPACTYSDVWLFKP